MNDRVLDSTVSSCQSGTTLAIERGKRSPQFLKSATSHRAGGLLLRSACMERPATPPLVTTRTNAQFGDYDITVTKVSGDGQKMTIFVTGPPGEVPQISSTAPNGSQRPERWATFTVTGMTRMATCPPQRTGDTTMRNRQRFRDAPIGRAPHGSDSNYVRTDEGKSYADMRRPARPPSPSLTTRRATR